MARRRFSPISLSFLDAMTCGFGATVLFLMIISANVELRAQRVTIDRRAEVNHLEEEVLEGFKNLVVLRNSLEELDGEARTTSGLSRRLMDRIKTLREELATGEEFTIAEQDHINRLKADLLSLEEGAKRLSAASPSDETPGDRQRAYVGDGDRQYLTGLKVGGERILILVDSSASMLSDTIVNVIRLRNLPDERKILARKWQQTLATVDWLTTQIPRKSRFQLYTFNAQAGPVIPGTEGQWLDGDDREVLDETVARLRRVVPRGATSLHQGFAAIREMQPAPDNVILLVDSLPTQGESAPSRRTVTGRQRLVLFRRAMRELPIGIPVNVVLFPMEGDPMAASSYWKLALATRGSLLSPPGDWP